MIPKFIIIHHSLTEDGQTVSWNAIRQYHVQTNGWKNIGYHYGIELIGDHYEILKGRMDDEIGAHCLGFNENSLGICRLGNFDISYPDERGNLLLTILCKSLIRLYNIPVSNVLGHWETYEKRNKPIEKSCPGALFSMPTFRKTLEV